MNSIDIFDANGEFAGGFYNYLPFRKLTKYTLTNILAHLSIRGEWTGIYQYRIYVDGRYAGRVHCVNFFGDDTHTDYWEAIPVGLEPVVLAEGRIVKTRIWEKQFEERAREKREQLALARSQRRERSKERCARTAEQ